MQKPFAPKGALRVDLLGFPDAAVAAVRPKVVGRFPRSKLSGEVRGKRGIGMTDGRQRPDRWQKSPVCRHFPAITYGKKIVRFGWLGLIQAVLLAQ